jgi:hypothetical protein
MTSGQTINDNSAAVSLGERCARWKPAGALLYFSGAALAARLAQDHGLPWPRCWIRQLTGVPCPTCGATRSLLALLRCDLPAALRFNPLFTVGCVALTIWVAAMVVDSLFGCRFIDRVSHAGKRWPLGRIAIALVALNWLYLVFYLPR